MCVLGKENYCKKNPQCLKKLTYVKKCQYETLSLPHTRAIGLANGHAWPISSALCVCRTR